jgi:hypothetical protein
MIAAFLFASTVCAPTQVGTWPNEQEQPASVARTSEGYAIPPPPAVPDGVYREGLAEDVERLVLEFESAGATPNTLRAVGRHGDPRAAWLILDVLRFAEGTGEQTTAAVEALALALRQSLPTKTWVDAWKTASDFLIAWDLPAAPGYEQRKQRVFTHVAPDWAPLFADPGALVDWRWISWGGVFRDDRALGELDGCPRGCIPALDEPAVTPAPDGHWYPDDAEIFGLVVDGQARAYPRHQLETHELVLDTLGGRRIALPYCTLCGAAQAYFTDDLPPTLPPLVLRTSGLLSRSNKVLYDLESGALFDTFTGRALSGAPRLARVQLTPLPVIASTWGAWKRAHPETTILAEDGGIGLQYDPDPLGGRDDAGPIFPVGAVDPRLDPQARVLGVFGAHGRPLAFDFAAARAALEAGAEVEHGGVRLELAGSGLSARNGGGPALPSHAAFWFAWSQFHPTTELWPSSRAPR